MRTRLCMYGCVCMCMLVSALYVCLFVYFFVCLFVSLFVCVYVRVPYTLDQNYLFNPPNPFQPFPETTAMLSQPGLMIPVKSPYSGVYLPSYREATFLNEAFKTVILRRRFSKFPINLLPT